jgi:6-pyruvoyltetrahydropterin/6-carboxytetrahydropterin synthase
MYEVGVVEQFEAAHTLRGNFGPASRRHGHTYKVELVVRGDSLQDDGTLCDIGVLQEALKRAVGELNYRDLDDLPAFAKKNSTAEVVAGWLVGQVKGSIPTGVIKSLKVRVSESPGAFASYEELLP